MHTARFPAAILLALLLSPALPAAPPMAPEAVGRVNRLPAADPHWLWVYDMVYDYMADGRATLIDGDTGRFLGMVNTGYSFTQFILPAHGRAIYSPETHYSRTTRGTRTDILAIYDPQTLAPVGEIVIPPKRGSTIPTLHNSILTDDERFALVFNITPATSVTVVDVVEQRFVTEIETPGCSLLYGAGPRRFFMLCTDGAALVVTLDDRGLALSKVRTPAFFDPEADPVSEKGARHGDTWYFASFDGYVHTVDAAGRELRFPPKWSLFSVAERAAQWRMGGTQHLAVHAARGELYSVMHQGPAGTRKESGHDVWVFDAASGRRLRQLKLPHLTGLIQVTQDDAPLLFGADVPVNTIHVYDAITGAWRRSIDSIGYTPTGMQTPVTATTGSTVGAPAAAGAMP